MKTYLTNLQNGHNKVQLITFGVLMIVLTAIIVVMHINGVIYFDKY